MQQGKEKHLDFLINETTRSDATGTGWGMCTPSNYPEKHGFWTILTKWRTPIWSIKTQPN